MNGTRKENMMSRIYQEGFRTTSPENDENCSNCKWLRGLWFRSGQNGCAASLDTDPHPYNDDCIAPIGAPKYTTCGVFEADKN